MERMNKKDISPDEYNEEYYLSECDGYLEFLSEDIMDGPKRLNVIWNLAELTSGMKVLDGGCGRGELMNKCIRNDILCVGIDYSKTALRLARKLLMNNNLRSEKKFVLIQSDLKRLPLESNYFDRVILSDVIEHIHPENVMQVLLEIKRVLRLNGKLIIHTMPNLWYYRFGYPLFRFVETIRGKKLPRNPRERYKFSHFHINEQTPKSLKFALNQAGFKSKVWLSDYRSYTEHPLIMRKFMMFVTRFPIINSIFCDDIFAIATKIHE
jgi:ubiquinone/menaquinone biosynthesis C-methylase UbiE